MKPIHKQILIAITGGLFFIALVGLYIGLLVQIEHLNDIIEGMK